jgi:hypothetical protein
LSWIRQVYGARQYKAAEQDRQWAEFGSKSSAGTRQNLKLPIMSATFVVRSLIVGAIVEEAR